MNNLPFPGIITLGTSLAMGLGFGFGIEKGGVYKPDVIVGQMLLRDFSMMKMFLSAGATSLVIHSLLSLLKPDAFEASRKENESSKTWFTTCVGAGLLGLGMATCGACPGTVLVQVGTGIPNALTVLGAGLFGALAYGMLFQRNCTPGSVGSVKRAVTAPAGLEQSLGLQYWQLGLAMAGLLAAAVYGFETLFPYSPGVPGAWPPHLAGIMVGSLQLPGMLLLHRTLGSSSAYSTLASCAACSVVPTATGPAFKAMSDRTYENFWQPLYLLGAIAGARYSISGGGAVPFASQSSIPLVLSALGGFSIVFGSRLAGGCTSGHGISGFSQLYPKSVAAVASMFGGGIATAMILSQFVY